MPKTRTPQERAAREASLAQLLQETYRLLARGQSAVSAVCRAVELLENDPLFNAGRGSKIQADGRIRMSASVMDGARLRFAGCLNVERVKNPIRLAEKLLRAEDRVLAGAGALAFARAQGLALASPYTARAREDFRKRLKGKSGTVGAVALDQRGRLAAATSTGGKGFEHPGRVSDSPTVAGNYANAFCAISATGIGEEIVDFAVAARLASLRQAGISLENAARGLLREASKRNCDFGFISLDRDGHSFAGAAHQLIWAEKRGDQSRVFV